MNNGYVTALGTPFDEQGRLVTSSYACHIEDQITNGATALLVMGTMGIEAFIRASEYARVAGCAVEVVNGRLPVLVGVMDCSVLRVRDRIDALDGLAIDGVVATAPFYAKTTQDELITFFTGIASESQYPLYLYDLPPVTQVAIEPDTVLQLMTHPNIKGIKSGVLPTCRIVHFSDQRPDDFTVMYSGLDTFDAAWAYGIRKNLDGMFSCTPALSGSLYKALEAGSVADARTMLDRILTFRNSMFGIGIWKGFTAAMNLLGYEGSFAPDYVEAPTDADRAFVKDAMAELKIS